MSEKPSYEEMKQRVNALEKELTERKLAEKSLLESETLLKAIMDNAPALISAKDLKGNVIMANRRFEILDGPTPEEFIGKNVYDLFPLEIADVLWKNDLAAIEADAPVESDEIVAHNINDALVDIEQIKASNPTWVVASWHGSEVLAEKASRGFHNTQDVKVEAINS